MSEDDTKLDFSLPERGSKQEQKRVLLDWMDKILVAVLVLILLNVILTLAIRPSAPKSESASFSEESLKQLALKMEKQGLNSVAADAWREYLIGSDLEPPEAAKIWYRIGKLHQDGENYELALDAFYRSESLHQNSELASEIGRRTQDSLEALGKFAALKHELADRVGLNDESATSGEEIVAEIGAQKISRAEIDRQIEANIENQLAMFAGQMPEEEMSRQKEAMLKQFTGGQQMLQFVNAHVVQEILYRKARESKLIEDPKVRAQLRDAERNLLAQQMMEREMADQIKISPNDVVLYYRANVEKYVAPERAKISYVVAEDEAAAITIIESGELGEGAQAIDDWVSKGGYIPEIGVSGEAQAAIFSTEAGNLVSEPVQTDKGWFVIQVREREPERQQPFEEVQRQVYQEFRQQKEREVQQKLLEDLREEYDVVIHQSKFAPKSEER